MSETETLPSKPQTKEKTSNNGGLWFIVLLMLAALISAIAAGGWFYWYQFMPLQQVQVQHAELKSQITKLSSQQSQVSQKLSKLDENQAMSVNRTEQIEALQAQQNATFDDISKMLAKLDQARPSDWLIAETDFLIRMAARKLWLEHDTRTAVMLLQEADRRLEETGQARLIPVRSALAEDIQQIKSINPVSISSIAFSLNGIISAVDNLPLETLQLPASASSDIPQVSEELADWKSNLSAVWHNIVDDFITIRRRETEVEPLMSEAQAFLAREQLRLSLIQAQGAALRAQSNLFSQALQQAMTALATHFKLSSHQVEEVISALQTLDKFDVSKSLPKTLKSQRILEEVITQPASTQKEETMPKGSVML